MNRIVSSIFVLLILIFGSTTRILAAGGGGDGETQACPCGYDGAGTLCWECPADNGCTSNAQCGGGICCGGSCVGQGECGGGGGSDCWEGSVNCQSGATIALGQPIQTFNSNNAWGQRMCGNIGSAQRITGCARTVCAADDENDCWCANNQVTTYRCCGAGSTEQCNTTNGNTYTITNSCFNPTNCRSGDVYVSHTSLPATVANRCAQGCNNCGQEDEESVWHYNVATTCRERVTTCSCVSTCSNTATSNISVVQGSSATAANVSWTVGTGGTSQRIYVDQSQTEVNNGCTTPNACEVNGTLASGTNSYIVTGLLPSTTYYFRVTNYLNASCNLGVVRSYTTPANNTVTGRVFMDANNNCSISTPWNSSTYGSLTATLRGTAYSGNIGTDGRFSISAGTAPSFSYLDLSGIPTGYICSTASGCNNCPTISSITSPSAADYPFYLTPRREAWWRVIGGSIYAEGNVRSELPRSTSDLIIAGAGGALGSLMQSTGSLDIGAGALSSAGYKATTEYKGKLMNYDYFAAHMGVTPNTANDWAVDTMNKPANNPNKAFYYINPSGSEASVSVPWTIAAGESYVIFVNGDLRIASDITIANGGFLAFIVNGSVRVSPAVANIGGLYVIDSTLITESNGGTDVAADFQGSVVAWGGVNLGRDLVGSNANSAAERFTYRPDLLTNMPDAMKVFALKWEEVVPGTIGN